MVTIAKLFKRLFPTKEKNLYIFRGLPGSGKSTAAAALVENVVQADDFFMVGGEYRFDATRLGTAHKHCRQDCEKHMKAGRPVAVANTGTRDYEMKAYRQMAEKYGYTVFTFIVENRHGGVNQHNVPEVAIERMKNRFVIKL